MPLVVVKGRLLVLMVCLSAVPACQLGDPPQRPGLRVSEPTLLEVGASWRLRADIHRVGEPEAVTFSTQLTAMSRAGTIEVEMNGGPFAFPGDRVMWASLPFPPVAIPATFVLRILAHSDEGTLLTTDICLKAKDDSLALSMCVLADEPPHFRSAVETSETF